MAQRWVENHSAENRRSLLAERTLWPRNAPACLSKGWDRAGPTTLYDIHSVVADHADSVVAVVRRSGSSSVAIETGRVRSIASVSNNKRESAV